MLIARNSPIKYKDLILALLEAVQLLTQVTVIRCRGHQRDGSLVSQGTEKLIQLQNRQLNCKSLSKLWP